MQPNKNFDWRWSLVALCMVVLTACGGGGGAEADGGTQPVVASATLNPTVQVIDRAAMDTLQSSGYTNAGTGILTAPAGNQISTLQVGQIAYLPASSSQEREVYVKVIDKKQGADGSSQLEVVTPAVSDVFSRIVFNPSNQVGLLQTAKTTVTMARGVKKKQGVLEAVAEQVGLAGLKIIDSNTYEVEIPFASKPKSKYAGNEIVKKGCEQPLDLIDTEKFESKSKWMENYCVEHFVLKGEVTYEKNKGETSFSATKNGDQLDFDSAAKNYILTGSKIKGSIGIESEFLDKNLSDLFSGLTQEELFGSLSGFGFGGKDSLIQARFSGLSADDKKGKIPLFGVLADVGKLSVIPLVGSTTDPLIKQSSTTLSMVFMVYALVDINIKGKADIKIIFEETNTETLTNIENGVPTVVSTITNEFGEKKPGDVKLGFDVDVDAHGQIGIPVDADLMVANMRIANGTAGIKAVADLNGSLKGDINVLTREPKLDGCISFGYGGGVFTGFSFGAKVYVNVNSSWFSKQSSAGFTYSRSWPTAEAETIDTVLKFPDTKVDPDWPVWIYTKPLDGCISTLAPEPVFQGVSPNYKMIDANSGVLNANQAYALISVDNKSKGDIDSVRIKYIKRNPFDFGIFEPSLSDFDKSDGVIDNLRWNKETKLIQYPNGNGLGSDGILMPEGEYSFLIEFKEKAFIGFGGRTGYVIGKGSVFYPRLSADVSKPTVGEKIVFHISSIWSGVKSVLWQLSDRADTVVTTVVNGVSEFSASFMAVSTQTVTAIYKDASDAILGQSTTSVTVSAAALPTATITNATSDTTTPPSDITNNGSTDDTTPTLSGTITAPLTSGQKINVYDGDVLFDKQVAVVSGTNWTFTPAVPRIGGLHSFTAEVAGPDGTPGARSTAYVINVLSANTMSIAPGEIMRTLTGSFEVVGSALPTTGLTVTVPGDPKAVCQSPSNMTTTGFGVACTFYKLGAQTLEIRTPSKLVGTVSVLVKTNVTGVTWTSPSTANSGSVKFGETVTFNVAGVNLLADTTMGFAVQLCGVSNVETGTPGSTQRRFTCFWNDQAGAVAGLMPGVVKDAPGGQVLFAGWMVPVEVAAPTTTIDIPATAFVRGENVALIANGGGLDALGNAPPYLTAANAAEWDFTVPTAGTYELFAEYASGLSRPVVISFNSVVKFSSALSAITGGWLPADRQVLSQGTVELSAGATTMRVARGDVFPHIKGFSLVLRPSALTGTFSVAAVSELGTSFLVPNGVSQCKFNAVGTWDTGAPFSSGPNGLVPITSWPGYGSWTWRLFSAPMMSLIAKDSSGTYTYIGESATLAVTQNSTMYFVANDGVGGHYDNSGSMSVSYDCQ